MYASAGVPQHLHTVPACALCACDWTLTVGGRALPGIAQLQQLLHLGRERHRQDETSRMSIKACPPSFQLLTTQLFTISSTTASLKQPTSTQSAIMQFSSIVALITALAATSVQAAPAAAPAPASLEQRQALIAYLRFYGGTGCQEPWIEDTVFQQNDQCLPQTFSGAYNSFNVQNNAFTKTSKS